MPWLADTNILLRLPHRVDPLNLLVRAALRMLSNRGEEIFYAPQNLVEFWRTCTRPASGNGFGLTISETNRRAKLIERRYYLAPDGAAVHSEWRQLVVKHAVSGVQVHDARLVAVMNVHGIANILTLNVTDFQRYPGINAIHPQQLIMGVQQPP
jgi:predicted nucleic acid-binding protein